MKVLALLALLLLAVPAQAQECQYWQTNIIDMTGPHQALQIRATRDTELEEWGYDGGKNFPLVINHTICGSGWLVEYRVATACVVWTGAYRSVTGLPCSWDPWQPLKVNSPRSPDIQVVRLDGRE